MDVSANTTRRSAPASSWLRYFNVMYALIMHDIKNRFFGSGLGQIVMVLWPLVHILVLIIIYKFTNRPYPYGDSIVQYSAVSIFPYIIFNYVARWITMSASQNKSFLQYPIIKPLDILIGRALIELVSITLVAILLVVFVTVSGSDALPTDPGEILEAILTTFFLAVGFGFLNAPFAFITPFWPAIVSLIMMLSYVSAGILFVASRMPESIRYPLSFNPLLHCVEWFRIAYYVDYPRGLIDRPYVLVVALTMMTLGLILLRLLRRFY